jgi:hypothetical protein
MMDIARQAFKEAQDDAYEHVQAVAGKLGDLNTWRPD